MTDSERGRWFTDDVLLLNAVLLVAAGSLAIALTSCLWHHIHPDPVPFGVTQSQSLPPVEHKDRKATRSKERRRRGKDPFRDILKSGKKSRVLLKTLKVADHDHAPLSVDVGNDSPSTSRSQSPEPAREASDPGTDSDDANSVKETIPNGDTSAMDMSDVPHGIRPESSTDTQGTLTVTDHVHQAASSSPLSCAAPVPRDSEVAKLVRTRTRSRASKIDLASDSVAPSISTRSADGAGPSTPTHPTPPRSQSPSDLQPLRTQLASMQGALEAARLREEQLRVEAEQANKERDEFYWRWNEDANVWNKREAELQEQIHHLVQQLQAYATVASFQALNSPAPTPPRGPFLMQNQHSASAPAHVQALLTSHPPGFAAPGAMSPLLWSGMGLCVPNRDPRHGGRQTPDSSASGSSSGRRRGGRDHVKSASDESSLGEWDGSGDEDGWEEEADIFRNNALADAILKRPESIQSLGVRKGKRSTE